MSRLLKSGWAWFALAAALVLLVGIAASMALWGWLHPEASTTVSNSETLRNVGFLIGGALAFVFALWRGWEAERQTNAARRQSETAQQSLLNERYQTGAEMLGHGALSVRLAGVYALRRLAEDHPEQYHLQIMELFCAFVRFPTKDNDIGLGPTGEEEQDDEEWTLRPDVQAVMQAISARSSTGLFLEQSVGFRLYLRDANISGLRIRNANLSRAWLTNANLSDARLPGVDLSGARLVNARLREANLSRAKLGGANLSRAVLLNAKLSGAELCQIDVRSSKFCVPVQGLTQRQLDLAWVDPDDPPTLDGVLDAETGKPLLLSTPE